MSSPHATLHSLLADAVLVLHFGVVLFVVGGLVLVITGHLRGWRWVDGWWFRAAHLVAIAFVVVQAWLGQTCPLTLLESWLRQQAGASGYTQSFIGHWVQRALYYDAPPWVFTVAYTVFGLLVVVTWWRFPPRRGKA
jgi:polyferredoxin